MSLLSKLKDAGLVVTPNPFWASDTNKDRDRLETVGIVNHWDAIKGEPSQLFYLGNNKFHGILYHIVVRRDGTVELLSQRYVYHAGKGDNQVLTALRAGEIPPKPTVNDKMGNSYLFGVAVNYHPDEGPMLASQYSALVTVNKVLLQHLNLSSNQIIDHRGWTDRKPDINTISMTNFRRDVDRVESPPNWKDVSEWAKPAWQQAFDAGILSEASEPKAILTKEEFMVFLARAGII